MGYRRMLGVFLFGLLIGAAGTASARAEFVEEFRSRLYAGQTSEAVSVARARLAAAPHDDNARFALGAAQFLQAVELLAQELHRYGLQSTYQDQYGLTGLPFLRLPVPDNPKPEELTYEAIRKVLATFVANLSGAEATLGQIHSEEVDLPLNLGLIRLDLDGDGKGSDKESLWRMFAVVTGSERWLNEQVAQQLLTDFDGSDVPWLRAYCHLLIAIAEFPLAHDWRPAFEVTFPTIFYMPGAAAGRKFYITTSEARARLEAIGPVPSPPEGMGYFYWKSTRTHEYLEAERIRKLRRPYEKILSETSVADLIALVHLTNWPVVERERLPSVLQHLEAVIRLSRLSWKRILAETDNSNEWIPNPSQTGVLPGMAVTQDRVDGWQVVLGEFEHILKGTKLIPHWRFDEGISFRRMLLEPKTFDIVLLAQGSAAAPYLEKGPVIDQARWDDITRVFGGDFLRYFIWFN